jgi:hypothetical protein
MVFRMASTNLKHSHISPETAKSHMKRMMVRWHVHPTKTRKDTLAADHFVEPLLITRTAAVLRLA